MRERSLKDNVGHITLRTVFARKIRNYAKEIKHQYQCPHSKQFPGFCACFNTALAPSGLIMQKKFSISVLIRSFIPDSGLVLLQPDSQSNSFYRVYVC